MPNCAETSPFSPIKHLICLKTDQNRRFILWKRAVSGYVWKCPGWTLRVFMHLYEGLHHFWTFFEVTFDLFVTILSHFNPIWGHTVPFLGPRQGHFWTILASFWGHFDVFVTLLGVVFGRLFAPQTKTRSYFGIWVKKMYWDPKPYFEEDT